MDLYKKKLQIIFLNKIEEGNFEHNHEKDAQNTLGKQTLNNKLKKSSTNHERLSKLICQEQLVKGDIEQLTAHVAFRIKQNIHANCS